MQAGILAGKQVTMFMYEKKTTINQIIKEAIESRGITQLNLARSLGYKTQSSIANTINKGDLQLSTVHRIMNALNYDVVIIDRNTGDQKWTVEEIEESSASSSEQSQEVVSPVIPIKAAARKHTPISGSSPMEQSLIADLEETFGPQNDDGK